MSAITQIGMFAATIPPGPVHPVTDGVRRPVDSDPDGMGSHVRPSYGVRVAGPVRGRCWQPERLIVTIAGGVQLLPRAQDQDPVKRATSLAVWSEGDRVDAQADELRRIVGGACLPGEFDHLQQVRESRAAVMEEAALQRRLKREGLKRLSKQRLFLIDKWERSLQNADYRQAHEFLALHEPALTSAQQDLLSWLDKADQLSRRAHGYMRRRNR